MYTSYANYVGGSLVAESSGSMVPVFNPSREVQLSQIPDSPAGVVDAAVRAAKTAQLEWGRRPAIERAHVPRVIADKIRQRVDKIAKVISEEQGKVLPLATIEVRFTAAYLDYMTESARRQASSHRAFQRTMSSPMRTDPRRRAFSTAGP